MRSGRRKNNSGTVEYRKGKKNPYIARVLRGSYTDSSGRMQCRYVSIGCFPTREAAEEALMDYNRTPYDPRTKIDTFAELYAVWSADYFENIKETSQRTVSSAYEYCSCLYDMKIREIGPGHIKDCMSKGYIIVKYGKDKGQIRYASKGTQERIKSMCNLMFYYAVESVPFDNC